MINKLPRWVEIGGFSLALIAGSVNAIALLGFNHQGVSHLSGSSSLLGVELAQGELRGALHLLLILLSFVLGAAISGCVIGHQSLKLGRRYGAALFIEATALLLAMLMLDRGSDAGHYLASAACGLQNAMTSTYSGAMVRTTHVTGLFTDLGIMLGLKLRGQPADRRRILLYLTLIGGFIGGGVLGALGYGAWHYQALLGASAMCITLGVVYLLYWHRQNHSGTRH
jgi:uncharacterized membrane protein YoaK (UPF0700 family)